jgi:hypothetical protein
MRNLICITLLVLSSVNGGLAAVTLIGPNLRNGSFESDVAAPWSGSPQVVQDATFASDGSWYALVQATASTLGAARNGPFQFFPTSKGNGLAFSLDFDARVGAIPFPALDIEFFGRNADGGIVGSIEPIMELTSLSSSQWQTYHAVFHLPDAWDGTQAQLNFLFEQRNGVSGVTYSGYLDNIVLQQIPEPSVIVLLTAGLLMFYLPRNRTCQLRR